MIRDADPAADGGLLRGYRSIRTIDRPDAPWPGVLTRTPSGDSCVLVDVDLLGPVWRGWDSAAAGHLLAPIDVLRRADGHDAALPACVESVEAFLARRVMIGALLSDGETVTLAVSIVRGAAEWAERTPREEMAGEWWLSDAGRPLFAIGAGADRDALADGIPGRPAGSSTVALLQGLADSTSPLLEPIVREAATLVAEPRALTRALDRWEARAFGGATPLPLATTILAPVRARGVVDLVGSAESIEGTGPRPGGLLAVVARHIDEGLADAASLAITHVWRRLRAPRSASRRRPWITAAAIAAAIVGIGVMWPGGSGGPATADAVRSAVASSPSSPPAQPSTNTPVEGATADSAEADPAEIGDEAANDSAPDGWEVATDELLSVRSACGDDVACLSEVMEHPREVHPDGAADLAPKNRQSSLVEDFGGAAVVRVQATDASVPPQLVVIVRVDDRFLLRDIHYVAEQEG